MRARLGLLLFCLPVLTISACSSNDRQNLNGRWQSIDAAQSCSLDFDNDGRITIHLSEGRVLMGKYTLLAGEFVEIELNDSWNGLVKHRERITFNGSEMTLRDADGTAIRFHKTNNPRTYRGPGI